MNSLNDVRRQALVYLARREHSRAELQRKLIEKNFTLDFVRAVLDQLETQDWLNEARFVESFIHSRRQKGCGPVRIQQELRQRGITDDLLSQVLEEETQDWIVQVRSVRQKRFGHTLPKTWDERAKQMRFLQYRGFTSEQIKAAFEDSEA
jgi:regulatory protein